MHSDPQTISTTQKTIAPGAIQPAPQVQQMFDDIAGRYDLLNDLLSAGIARLWWRRAANASGRCCSGLKLRSLTCAAAPAT